MRAVHSTSGHTIVLIWQHINRVSMRNVDHMAMTHAVELDVREYVVAR
jgi:hypothetical protein